MKINKILIGCFFAGFILTSTAKGQTIASNYSKDFAAGNSEAALNDFTVEENIFGLKIKDLSSFLVRAGETNISIASFRSNRFTSEQSVIDYLSGTTNTAPIQVNEHDIVMSAYSIAAKPYDVIDKNLNGIIKLASSSSENESKKENESFFQRNWFYFAGAAVLAVTAYLLWPNRETPRNTGVTFGLPSVPR